MDNSNINIRSFCTINNGLIVANGIQKLGFEASTTSEFLSLVYKDLKLDYPKFFKMDNLSKLAMLGTEVLLESDTSFDGNDAVALCFFNAQSSLDSDWNHQKLINQNKAVSPSVFVYTLPNILMGELAIKHNWHGENLFILASAFNFDSWLMEAKKLFALNKAQFCIGGWVEVFEEHYDLKLFFAEKASSVNALSIEKIKTLIST